MGDAQLCQFRRDRDRHRERVVRHCGGSRRQGRGGVAARRRSPFVRHERHQIAVAGRDGRGVRRVPERSDRKGTPCPGRDHSTARFPRFSIPGHRGAEHVAPPAHSGAGAPGLRHDHRTVGPRPRRSARHSTRRHPHRSGRDRRSARERRALRRWPDREQSVPFLAEASADRERGRCDRGTHRTGRTRNSRVVAFAERATRPQRSSSPTRPKLGA